MYITELKKLLWKIYILYYSNYNPYRKSKTMERVKKKNQWLDDDGGKHK